MNYCVQWAVNGFEWYGEAIDKIYDEVAPTDKSVLATITREPVGVVAAGTALELARGAAGLEGAPGTRSGE